MMKKKKNREMFTNCNYEAIVLYSLAWLIRNSSSLQLINNRKSAPSWEFGDCNNYLFLSSRAGPNNIENKEQRVEDKQPTCKVGFLRGGAAEIHQTKFPKIEGERGFLWLMMSLIYSRNHKYIHETTDKHHWKQGS